MIPGAADLLQQHHCRFDVAAADWRAAHFFTGSSPPSIATLGFLMAMRRGQIFDATL